MPSVHSIRSLAELDRVPPDYGTHCHHERHHRQNHDPDSEELLWLSATSKAAPRSDSTASITVNKSVKPGSSHHVSQQLDVTPGLLLLVDQQVLLAHSRRCETEASLAFALVVVYPNQRQDLFAWLALPQQ